MPPISWFLCRTFTGHDGSFCHRAMSTGRGLRLLKALCGERHLRKSFMYHELRLWIEDQDGRLANTDHRRALRTDEEVS